MGFLNILGLILSPLFWFFPSPFPFVRDVFGSIGARKRNRDLHSFFESSKDTMRGIIPLGIGAPYRNDRDIVLSESERAFFVPLPSACRDSLSTFNQDLKSYDDIYRDTNNCLNPNFWGEEKLRTAFSTLGLSWDDNTKEELITISEKVACTICKILNSKSTTKPFNGLMYGVLSFEILPNRDESQQAVLSFYKTDFFSFRVFSYYYRTHKMEFCDYLNVSTFPGINKIPIPFLSSFGVSIIAIVSGFPIEMPLNDSDLIVIAKRSSNVPDNPGTLHFTMNEAFIPGDTDNNNDDFQLSIIRCATRGFEEETEWRKEPNRIQFSQYRFTSVFYDSVLSQMGITGLVKICVKGFKNMKKAQEHLTILHNSARDKVLETEKLDFIPIKKLDQFIADNEDKMSNSFSYAIKVFSAKYRGIKFSK